MTELYHEIDITNDEAETIARGLYAVARADGDIHPAEAAIISQFYTSGADASHLDSLHRESDIEPEVLAQKLPGSELRELFLRTAILLAYADGNYADGEKQKITAFARAMNVSDDSLKQSTAAVKDFLLSQLSHLQNVDASIAVARELDI